MKIYTFHITGIGIAVIIPKFCLENNCCQLYYPDDRHSDNRTLPFGRDLVAVPAQSVRTWPHQPVPIAT